MHLSPYLPVCLLLATTASAQIGIGRTKTDNLPGDGTLPAGSVNVTETVLNSSFGNDGSDINDLRGAVRLPNGNYLVSLGQNGGPGGGRPHQYFELASDGSYIGNFDQPFLLGANGDFGLTDLAWDMQTDAGSRVWGGRTKTIASFDWQTGQFDPFSAGVNGTKLLQDFQGADVRAIAIGQIGGQQILISGDNNVGAVGDPDDAGVNYHVMEQPVPFLPTWQDPTPSFFEILDAFDTGKNGAAFNPLTETVWWQVEDRDNNPNPNASRTRFVEMSLDGNLTGKVVQGDRTIGGRALGCDLYIDDNGNPVLVYLVSAGEGSDNPLGLTTGDDILVEMYLGFEFGSSCGGDVGFDTEPYIGNADWAITLRNAPDNPTMSAILVRGAADPVGFQIPGINNCALHITLGTFNNRGAKALANGEANHPRPLPNDIGLIGVEATWQWLLPSSLNILPLDLSNAGTARIGTNM